MTRKTQAVWNLEVPTEKYLTREEQEQVYDLGAARFEFFESIEYWDDMITEGIADSRITRQRAIGLFCRLKSMLEDNCMDSIDAPD